MTDPIIIKGKPSRLPIRGPLQKPTEITTKQHMRQVLHENELLLQVIKEMTAEHTVKVDPKVLPLIERLHRNIMYLAILKETENSN